MEVTVSFRVVTSVSRWSNSSSQLFDPGCCSRSTLEESTTDMVTPYRLGGTSGVPLSGLVLISEEEGGGVSWESVPLPDKLKDVVVFLRLFSVAVMA